MIYPNDLRYCQERSSDTFEDKSCICFDVLTALLILYVRKNPSSRSYLIPFSDLYAYSRINVSDEEFYKLGHKVATMFQQRDFIVRIDKEAMVINWDRSYYHS